MVVNIIVDSIIKVIIVLLTPFCVNFKVQSIYKDFIIEYCRPNSQNPNSKKVINYICYRRRTNVFFSLLDH